MGLISTTMMESPVPSTLARNWRLLRIALPMYAP